MENLIIMKQTQDRNERIKSFIDSVAESQAANLLESNLEEVGGLRNAEDTCAVNGDCKNVVSCGQTINTTCKNGQDQCIGADNSLKCEPYNDLVIKPGTNLTQCLCSNYVESACRPN